MASVRGLRLAGVAALVAAALPVAASAAAASWPGSNGDIFVAEFDAGDRSIVRFNPAGEVVDTVASGNLTEFSSFSLDAEGRRLAFSRNGEIVILDLESMDEMQITESPASDRDPTFSYDGRYLVWVSADNSDSEIFMWDLTDPSSPAINLTNNNVDDWAPAFGNDGTGHGDLIAYVSLEGATRENDSSIWTMTPGGTDKTNLTAGDPTPNFGPNWHPSFDVLAYSGQDAEGRDQIFTMSWDGSGKDQLTSDDNYNYEPAWSPDGTKIVFTKQGTAVGAVGRIYVRSGAPGGTETPLTPSSTKGYDRAEWQAAPGGCEPNCEPIMPTLVFSLKRHVVVSGHVIGEGAAPYGGTCGVGTPIKIQRLIAGKFKTIASTTTNANGTFSKKVPDRTGKYRVVSTNYTDEASGTECLGSQAAAKTHRHR